MTTRITNSYSSAVYNSSRTTKQAAAKASKATASSSKKSSSNVIRTNSSNATSVSSKSTAKKTNAASSTKSTVNKNKKTNITTSSSNAKPSSGKNVKKTNSALSKATSTTKSGGTRTTVRIRQDTNTDEEMYYDVLLNRAARKAGVTVSAYTGEPRITGAHTAIAYYMEKMRFENAFWCQTGGWSELPNDGQCARTAAATMASINTDYTVTPNETTGDINGLSGIYIDGKYYKYSNEGRKYNINSGADIGLNRYTYDNERDLISSVNNELALGRSVIVKTTVSGEHWVTVTGTQNGHSAVSFDDFIGVDPWYNGNNPGNCTQGTGQGSRRNDREGVIQLSKVKNQHLHSEYAIITFNPNA